MLVRELFEGTSRSEFDWNNEMASRPEEYGLVTRAGQIVRRELSKNAAVALQGRPDLIKKYGVLSIRRLA